jgi:prepilin-type N-terminal cleavage/methylation domain-containing protein
MLKRIKEKTQAGFTIIEVMIVLAIAGLILVVVLVAVPQLQKNQRNEARKSVLARISTEVSNYIGNNEGVVPTQDDNTTTGFEAPAGGFYNRYILNAPQGTFNKPGGGEFTYVLFDNGATSVDQDDIAYKAGGVCVGELPSGTGTARNFAIAVGLEGGSSYCVDNQ